MIQRIKNALGMTSLDPRQGRTIIVNSETLERRTALLEDGVLEAVRTPDRRPPRRARLHVRVDRDRESPAEGSRTVKVTIAAAILLASSV